MSLITSCACCPPLGTFVADALDRRDPTGTTRIRRKFEAELERRFRAIARLIRKALVIEDVLGLRSAPTPQPFMMGFARDALLPPPARAFAFYRNTEKIDAFMAWLYEMQKEGILGIQTGSAVRLSASDKWANIYIESAYKKGMSDAYGLAKVAGAPAPDLGIGGAFLQPIHAERVGLIYTRTFNSLEGISDTMGSQISRVLAQGMAEGRSPAYMAREMVKKVEDIGIVRARTLARTEVISAHAEAQLTSFEEAGLEDVTVMAEFSTAGDDQVCPECADLEGNEYTVDQARGMIPVHPNCRCTYIPVVKS